MEQAPQHVKKGMKMLSTLLVAVGIFLVGVYVGYENRPAMAKVVDLVHKETPEEIAASTDFAPFWKAWQIVESKYPGASETDSTERMYGAIKGLLASFGDPYTTFFPPKESEEFETQISGEFSGVGIEIDKKDGILTVIAPLKGTPAEAAGMKAGDKIIKVDDTIAAELSIDEAIDLIRGEDGTMVSLTVLRDGTTEPKVFTLKRAKISIPTVATEVRAKDGVFIISLYNFSSHSYNDFRGAMQEYLASGYHNLLLDLRGNPGGYLTSAVDMAGLFLSEGKVVVKEIGKTEDDLTLHTTRNRPIFPSSDKLVILVDKGSASASEILAGALSEHGIGTLAGTKTFGKGSVQELVRLTSDTSLKVTVAKWYTPNGVSISDSGLQPKIEVLQDVEAKSDVQLDRAVALFKNL